MRHFRIKYKKRLLLVLIPVLGLGIGLIVYSFMSTTVPRLKVVTIEGVATTKANIQYCDTKNSSRTLNLYYPKTDITSKLPLVIYIHGGGWSGGDESGPLLDAYGPQFIGRGIAVAAIDYRLNSKNPYPDQNDDIACALSYLDKNADMLNIDTSKIIYFGDSAGGQLAAFAALTVPYKEYDYTAPVGVIDFYGVSDFSKIIGGKRPDRNARRYLGSKYSAIASQASPTTYVTKYAPRFLFVHGNKDTVVPLSQSKTFHDLLMAAGSGSEYIVIEGAGHAFIGPELPVGQYTKIQMAIDAFLQKTIRH